MMLYQNLQCAAPLSKEHIKFCSVKYFFYISKSQENISRSALRCYLWFVRTREVMRCLKCTLRH